jgi:hypothetical protein
VETSASERSDPTYAPSETTRSRRERKSHKDSKIIRKIIDESEMIAVEVEGMDRKYAWEIIGIYRAPNVDMLAIKISCPYLTYAKFNKRSFVGGDLNLPKANVYKRRHADSFNP